MATTNPQDARAGGRAADHFVTVLAGLEIIGQAAATIVDWGDTLREDIDEAILNGDPRPTGTVEAIEYYAPVATIAALSTLADTEDDDLENPIQRWIRNCPTVAGLFRHILDGNHSQDVSMFGSEIVLPRREDAVKARLITGDSNEYAELIVYQGLEVTIRNVHCPATIKEVYNVAMDC